MAGECAAVSAATHASELLSWSIACAASTAATATRAKVVVCHAAGPLLLSGWRAHADGAVDLNVLTDAVVTAVFNESQRRAKLAKPQRVVLLVRARASSGLCENNFTHRRRALVQRRKFDDMEDAGARACRFVRCATPLSLRCAQMRRADCCWWASSARWRCATHRSASSSLSAR